MCRGERKENKKFEHQECVSLEGWKCGSTTSAERVTGERLVSSSVGDIRLSNPCPKW